MNQYFEYLKWTKENSYIWEFENSNLFFSNSEKCWNYYEKLQNSLSSIPNYISKNSQIHESVVINGNVIIEDGAQLLANSIIQGPCYIGKDVVIGNFSFVRGNCFLSRNSLIGNHCYCNESVLGKSVRIAHYCNFSRSIIGYNSSISAFVLTATVKANKKPIINEGKAYEKRGCIIGSSTFIAPHTTLSPNIVIGNNCFIGSFLVINENINDGVSMYPKIEVEKIDKPFVIPVRKKVKNFITRKDFYERVYSGVLIISTDNKLILQRRDNKSSIVNPNKISTFGGTCELNESPVDAAVRELKEELNLIVTKEELTFLTETIFIREDKTQTQCNIFILKNIDPNVLEINEGQKIELLNLDEAIENIGLTDLCRISLLEYIKLLTTGVL